MSNLPDPHVPPHSIEAEMSVLGAMLLDPMVSGEVTELLEPDDFYREAHRTIYDSILSLLQREMEADLVALAEILERSGKLAIIGGRDYLVELCEILPSTANARHYARIVRDHSQRRRLARAADRIRLDALTSPDESGEVLDRAEAAVFEIGERENTRKTVKLGDILEKTFERIEAQQKMAGVLTGLDTGYYRLNDLTGGLQKGELIVVAARPSMGKTTFALNMARNACLNVGARVLIFSMEMSEHQIVQNVLCAEARVDATRLRKGLSDRDWARLSDAAGRLHACQFLVDATPGLTPLAIRSKARRVAVRLDGLDLVVVDYLQLVNVLGRSENRQQEISLISRSLKDLARELECPVIAISQLNRSVDAREDHRPRLSDLRESGAIEQDADIIVFLFREDYYAVEKEDPSAGSKTEILIAKNRNGPTGKVDLLFFTPLLRFENLAAESSAPAGA